MNGVDAFGVPQVAAPVNINEGVFGFFAEADSGEDLGVLPLFPEAAGSEGIVFDGAPVGCGLVVRVTF